VEKTPQSVDTISQLLIVLLVILVILNGVIFGSIFYGAAKFHHKKPENQKTKYSSPCQKHRKGRGGHLITSLILKKGLVVRFFMLFVSKLSAEGY